MAENYLPPYDAPQKWLDTLKDVPEYWKGSLEDIEDIVKTIKRGKVTLGCKSAGGRNIYMIEYGERNHFTRTSSYVSATSDSKDTEAYANKTADGMKPCLMLFGGIHGAEFEGIVVLLNLIQILETGKDFRGEENKEIYDLAEQFHLIIIPSINPDGRARFPYKSVWGMPIKTFRYFAQGTWKDGSLCMHPACKQIHPIKEASGFLGCYFNDDGYNIQQDILPVITREGRFLHEVAHEFAPDVIMNLHGCCDSEGFLCGGGSAPQKIRNEITQFESKLGQELAKQGCMFLLTPKTPVGDKVNFPMGIQNALHLSCGAISLLYESNQGVDYERDEYLPGTQMLSYEGIYNAHFTMFRELMLFTKRTFETRRAAVKKEREKK